MAWIGLWMIERQRREEAERRVRVSSSGVTHDLREHTTHCDIPHIDAPIFIDSVDDLQQEKERIITEIEKHRVAMAELQQKLFLVNEKLQSFDTSAKRGEN